MTLPGMPRVMWLVNHGPARKFEIAMLKRSGINEIFLPKRYPDDPEFWNVTVDYAEDAHLTIPQEELRVLNNVDWYREPDRAAWEIANRYFDILFFSLHHPDVIKMIAKRFQGVALWRAYGNIADGSFADTLQDLTRNQGAAQIGALGNRFYFAGAHEHLQLVEPAFLKNRHLYLPPGLLNGDVSNSWRGHEKRIFFVCPNIGFDGHHKNVYKQFIENFKEFPYTIGGAQPIRVHDDNVLGNVPPEEYERKLQAMRVMFYHGQERNHLHDHPFEAVRAGMPLVFMADGMLDRLGGRNLPGRCASIAEARGKIGRVLNDDRKFIEEIRRTQICLLQSLKPENCVDAWHRGVQKIGNTLEKMKAIPPLANARKYRIAVIVPILYRGGSLRGAKLLAQAIDIGSKQAGHAAEVVLGHLDDPTCYSDESFADLNPTIKRRPYRWRILNQAEAHRAMAYAGLERPMTSPAFIVPDDGINQFMDCDLWVIISDRLSLPLLPVRPHVLMVYDYLQRYEPVLGHADSQLFVRAAHAAQRIFVSTEFTRQDAVQFAGIPAHRVVKLPMLAPAMSPHDTQIESDECNSYFVWTTNIAPHKNHENAFKALRLYYEEYDGTLNCHVTGVDTKKILDDDLPQFKLPQELIESSPRLKQRVRILGELSETAYQSEVANCAFLWHAGRIDNGTFSVVEAAQLGTRSLSSDYPAMREMDAQFGLDLAWMDAHDPTDMARQLKRMEIERSQPKTPLPISKKLACQSIENLASTYWHAVRECL